MPIRSSADDLEIRQRFGGGLNTRSSEDEVSERESADEGKNFRLDPVNFNLRPRRPFDLLATAPNEAEIRGMINLVKSDGTVKIGVQAGDKVYEYENSGSGFNSTPVATVSAGAKLRGRIEHNWALADKVIITDLTLTDEVAEWDGTTFQTVTFSPSATSMKAKYAVVADERLWLANVDTGSPTPHLFAASEVSDYTVIDVANRPSSSLGDSDPFYLVSGDLRPINGFLQEFGRVLFSTEDGRIYILNGSTAKDFAIDEFFARSNASGAEAMIAIGNLLLYGRRGRIELLSDTDRYADSEANDLSLKINEEIKSYKNWTIAYNNRLQTAYCFPSGVGECWTFHLPMLTTNYSPWVKYETEHALDFQPTCVMNMIDPEDGLEYVYMGDADGNFYRMEGSGQGDGGSSEIETVFTSRLYNFSPDMEMNSFDGYVKYKKQNEFNVDLTLQFAGRTARDETKQVQISAADAGGLYGGSSYYGGSTYYGQKFTGRLIRQYVSVPGQGEDVQIKVAVTSDKEWQINEVFFRFNASNK